MDNIQQQFYYPLGRKTLCFFILRRAGLFPFFLALGIAAIVLKNIFGANSFVEGVGSAVNWVILALFIISFLTLAIGTIMAFLQYRTSRVMFDEDSFHIVRGAVGKDEVDIPYRRIQSVEIKQPFIYRIAGLGHVAIATTTDLERPNQMAKEINEEVIATIDYPLAKTIEKTLTDRAEVERFESVGKTG